MTGRMESAEDFLARSAEVLDEAPAPLTACAWCSHPLTDASPSGEFCGERCASDWRAGLDWTDEERCACHECDPEGVRPRPRPWVDAYLGNAMRSWLDAIHAEHRARYSGGSLFQTQAALYRGALYDQHVVPEIVADTAAAARTISDLEQTMDGFRRRHVVGVDPAGDGWYSLGVDETHQWDVGGLVGSGTLTHLSPWVAAEVWDEAVDPPRAPRWAGRKPNRRRRKRR